MDHEIDAMKYFMAAEKVECVMGSIDRLIEFVEEFKISPDEEVKMALKPSIDKLKDWIE